LKGWRGISRQPSPAWEADVEKTTRFGVIDPSLFMLEGK
jgi:hypothetical protein